MREWLRKHGEHWTFGLFVLALLGTVAGLGVWGLNAQDARQTAEVEKVSAIAESAIRRVEEKAGSEVKRLDSRVESNLGLIKQISARLDRMDDRFDRMDVKLDRMNGRLDQMQGRLDRMEGRLGQMDGRLDRIDGKLDTLLMRVSATAAN